jgi:hypothetical protein
MTTFMFFWGLETPVGLRNMETSTLLHDLCNNVYFSRNSWAWDVIEGRVL